MDEQVLIDEPCLVGSLQLIIEGQSAAQLAIHLKVAQGLAGLLETLVLWNDHNCGVEWSEKVASDLGLAVKYETSLIQDNCRYSSGRACSLRQVIQVEVVLSFGLITHLHFLFFLFVYEGNLSKFYFLFFGYCSLSEAFDLLDYNLRFDAPFKPW